MKKNIVIPIVAILSGVIACLGVFAAGFIIDHRVPNFSRTKVLYVYPETTAAQVADSLSDIVIRSRSLSRAFRKEDVAGRIKPGRYQVDPSNSSIYVARMLSSGWQTPCRLVLSGTLRDKGTIARRISGQMMVDSAAVASALIDGDILGKYGFSPRTVFALFMPDTYEMYWTASVEEILERQKAEYDAFWTDENKKKAEALGLSQMEVSILASIVNGESNYEPEFPKIAGVYLNRLRKGMKLQADPTVAFCFDYKLNRVLNRHLTVDSPYNTYLHEGLPPGPICVPTKASLNAVLNPDRHGYLFFCASPDFNGSHRFAVTLQEHSRNAREFQAALNARSKNKGK